VLVIFVCFDEYDVSERRERAGCMADVLHIKMNCSHLVLSESVDVQHLVHVYL